MSCMQGVTLFEIKVMQIYKAQIVLMFSIKKTLKREFYNKKYLIMLRFSIKLKHVTAFSMQYWYSTKATIVEHIYFKKITSNPREFFESIKRDNLKSTRKYRDQSLNFY